tara:strand:+ start:294 stop:650 length:357 start_codon:yes stop_codon:yes gene_type:complete
MSDSEEKTAEEVAEEKELEEQMAELKRLQELNNAQWKLAAQTNFENMPFTESGMKKKAANQRARVVQGFMHNLTRAPQQNMYSRGLSSSLPQYPIKQNIKINVRRNIRQSGMMFGRFR